MASYFATQLKDMFFVLVERVTGYGWGEDQDAAGTKQSKITSADQDSSRTDEEQVTVVQNIQIRARSGDPFVSGGSMPQKGPRQERTVGRGSDGGGGVRDPAAPIATAVSENAATSARPTHGPTPAPRRRREAKLRWRAPLEHTGTRQSCGRGRARPRSRRVTPGSGVPSPPAKSAPARRVGVRASRRGSSAASRGGGAPSPGGERPRRPQLAVAAGLSKRVANHRVGTHSHRFTERIPRSRVNRSSTSPRAVTDTAGDGCRGARDHLRAGAAEGGGGDGGVGARAAEEARRREGRAPAPALHAAVVRRRQWRRDAEDSGGGGGRDRRRGLRRLCCLPVLRVAGRLHRELPQEPGLRDHLRPPRHGGVRGGRGGGADDGQLAVQEAGHDGDRGGGGSVRGRGHLCRGVRVGLQRAQQDRPDVHAGVQRLRRLPHRQHRRGALLRGRAPGLVRRHMSTRLVQRLDRQYTHRASIYR